MTSKPTIAILGASSDRRKFGNKAVRAFVRQGYDVYPINPRERQIEGLTAYARLSDLPVDTLDRISLYVPPQVGMGLLEQIAATPHSQLWFNPGSESDELLEAARAMGLEPIVACSIVDIGSSPYEFGAE
jgi:predicted CoA-binding protein